MSQRTQSPEPWHVGLSRESVIDSEGFLVADLRLFGATDFCPEKNEANAARIVACVNAMAGVADPSAIQRLVEAAEAAWAYYDDGHPDDDGALEGFSDRMESLKDAAKALRPEPRKNDD